MPRLVEIEEKYGERGFKIFAISHESSATISRVIKNHDVNYVVGQDYVSFGKEVYDVSGYPSTYLIDADGNFMQAEMPSDEQIEEMIKDLVPKKIERDLDKSLKKTVAEYNEGAYGKAASMALKIKQDENSKPEEVNDAEYVLDIIERRVIATKEKIEKLVHDYVKSYSTRG